MGPEHPVTIWTIGHSNRSFDDFAELLHAQEITLLVDVRAHPGSRKHPQFGTDTFADLLRVAGIGYRHSPELGGRRRLDPAAAPELADGWRNPSFRAYAQHTRTDTFRDGVEALRQDAAAQRTIICCSESVPWRCHRWIVSDVLTARGDEVRHVLGAGQIRTHAWSRFAMVRDGTISWPPGTEDATVAPRVQQRTAAPR